MALRNIQKRETMHRFEVSARRISREGQLKKNSICSQYVLLILAMKLLTGAPSCFFGIDGISLGCRVSAVMMQSFTTPGLNCLTCTTGIIAGITEKVRSAVGAITGPPANFQQMVDRSRRSRLQGKRQIIGGTLALNKRIG